MMDGSYDFLEMAKWHYKEKTKEIEDLLTVLNLNLDSQPVLRKKLMNCACLLLRNGVNKVDRFNILSTCAKRMMEQTIEVQFTKQLQLFIIDLENIMKYSLDISQQLHSDIRHHKNTDMLSSQLVEIENSETFKNVNISSSSDNDLELNPHKKILELKKEINLKKKAIERMKKSMSEFDSLPPDIQSARVLLENAKLKADMLKKEIELSSNKSFADTSLYSFSP